MTNSKQSETIGVVIPTYNRANLIKEALNSVLFQTVKPALVVVVDDGSIDNTADVFKEWEVSVNSKITFKYVFKENGGPGSARNEGIRQVSGCTWVAFLDSDDLWPESHLEDLLAAINSDEHFVGCSSEFNEVYYDSDWNILSQRMFKHGKSLNIKNQGPLSIMLAAPQTSCAMVKTSVAESVGGFNEKLTYGEDKLFFMEVSCHGKWGRSKGQPVVYRNIVKPTSGAKQLSNNPHQNSRVYYARLLDNALSPNMNSPLNWHQGINWALWKGWYRAGRRLEQLGHLNFARAYYWKAATYRPFSKASLRFLKIRIFKKMMYKK